MLQRVNLSNCPVIPHPSDYTFRKLVLSLPWCGLFNREETTVERWHRIGLLTGLALVLLLALAACGGSGGAGGTTQKVTGKDIAYTETQLTAPANQPITINFTNSGALVHSIVFDLPPANDKAGDVGVPAGWATGQGIAAGQSATLTLPALPAGQYRYYCAVPGHTEAGMVGTLTVK